MLDGGEGVDVASYADSAAAITINLGTTLVDAMGQAYSLGSGGDAGGDRLRNIENIIGSDFNDVITGNAQANKLDGGAGDDTITGGLGADTINGGAGLDTASYADSTLAVTVSLVSGSTNTGGSAQGDILSLIENLTGSNYNDNLTGDASANIINAGDGNDTITGGLGADTINGGAGLDTSSYADSAVAVTVSLVASAVNTGGTAQGDILSLIENLTGSNYDDALTGDNNINVILGGDGNDTIIGGLGADNINGGAGIDTSSYADSTVAVTVNLAAGSTNTGGTAEGDILSLIENLTGSNFNDTLLGDGNANGILGGDGNDTIRAGLGADIINGGAGIDTSSYADSAVGVTVSLVTGSINTGGTAAGDVLTDIENLYGSNFNDIFTGDANVNIIYGVAGNDTIIGGLGADTINGGAGIDTSSYSDSTVGVTVSLVSGAANTGGSAAGDVLSLIENLTGSNFNDILTGDTTANVISGGLGNDTINGGAGSDNIDGGAGVDTVDYRSSSAAVSVNMNSNVYSGGDAAGDTLVNIENIFGSSFADMLAGNTANNIIYGGSGNDSIYGVGGNDVLHGGAGVDTFHGGLGNDSFNFTAIAESKNGAFDTILDFTIGQDKINLSGLASFGIDTFADLTITKTATETVIKAYDTVHPAATDYFEVHLTGVLTLQNSDFIWV